MTPVQLCALLVVAGILVWRTSKGMTFSAMQAEAGRILYFCGLFWLVYLLARGTPLLR